MSVESGTIYLDDRPVVVEGSDGVSLAVYGFPYLEPEHAQARLARGDTTPPRFTNRGNVPALSAEAVASLTPVEVTHQVSSEDWGRKL